MKNIFTHKRERQQNNAFKVQKNTVIDSMSRTVRIGVGPFADGLYFNKSVLNDNSNVYVEPDVIKETKNGHVDISALFQDTERNGRTSNRQAAAYQS